MTKRRRIQKAMVILTMAAGCGETAPVLTGSAPRADRLQGELKAGPEWVREDCRPQMAQPGLCAVGVVAGIRNPSLARETAESRGQAGIARQLNALIEEVGRDFEDSVGVDERGQEGQHSESGRYHRNSMHIIGARVTKWWASETGSLYAMVVLEPNGMAATLTREGEVSHAVRSEVMRRAERVYQELRQGEPRQ